MAIPRSCLVIRAPTNRPNHRYHAVGFDPTYTTGERFVVDVAKHVGRTHLGNGKTGIIFCQSMNEVDLIAESFDGCKSHSGMDPINRMRQQRLWMKGERQWLVSTSGMAQGIDSARVSAVIFLGIPYGMIYLVQAAGRAGRNKSPALIISLYPTNLTLFAVEKPALNDSLDNLLKESYTWERNSDSCRRQRISNSMDGVPRHCQGDDLHCDVCEPDTALLQAIQALLLDPPAPPAFAKNSNGSITWSTPVPIVAPKAASIASSMGTHTGTQDSRAQPFQPFHPPASSSRAPYTTSSFSAAPTPSAPFKGTAKLAVHRKGASMSIAMDVQYALGLQKELQSKVSCLKDLAATKADGCVICLLWRGVYNTSFHAGMSKTCAAGIAGYLMLTVG